MNYKDIYHIREYIYLTNDLFPTLFITETKLYYVDTTHLIWCCKKAMDRNHICCYALCNNCFILLDEDKKKKSARETTSRRVKKKAKLNLYEISDNEDNENNQVKKKTTKDTKCTTRDHDNLNVVSDKYRFKEKYLEKMNKGKGNYPLLCSKCKIRFSAQTKSCGDGKDGGNTNIEIQDTREVIDALV